MSKNQLGVQPAVPTDADIDAAMQAFDWDGWIDQDKAKRAFTREVLARWAAPAHPAEEVPAQCPNINEPRGCWRVACQLGGKCREPERAATQPAAQGLDAQDASRWREAIKKVGAENQLGAARYVIRGLEAPRNVMRGCVAGHFTKSIDAAIAAQAKQGGA